MISRSSLSAIPSRAAVAFALQAATSSVSPAVKWARAIASYAAAMSKSAMPAASLIARQRRACQSAGSSWSRA